MLYFSYTDLMIFISLVSIEKDVSLESRPYRTIFEKELVNLHKIAGCEGLCRF